MSSSFAQQQQQELSTLQDCFVGRAELDLILSRISGCVITISDMERTQDNKLVLEHYFPWWSPFLEKELEKNDGEEKVRNAGKYNHTSLVPGSEQVILNQNQLDEQVYQFGLALFEEQVRLAARNKQQQQQRQQR